MDSQHKFFSIIVPLYNPNMEHLSNAIDSITGQTIIGECEVIFVDDNSPSKDYRSKLEEVPASVDYRLIVLEENLGPGLSRQRGLDEAAGEWVTFVDQDDTLYDNTVLERAKERLVSSGATFMMNTVCRIATDYDFGGTGLYIDEFCRDWLHGKFINRDALKQWGITFSSEMKSSEDTYFCGKLSVIEFHELVVNRDYRICVNEPDFVAYVWYLWDDSTSHTIQDGGLEYFEKSYDTFRMANEAALEYALEKYDNPLFYVPRGINAICMMYWYTQQYDFIHRNDGIETDVRAETYKFIRWLIDKLGWTKEQIKEMVYGQYMGMYFDSHTEVGKSNKMFIALESFEDFMERME